LTLQHSWQQGKRQRGQSKQAPSLSRLGLGDFGLNCHDWLRHCCFSTFPLSVGLGDKGRQIISDLASEPVELYAHPDVSSFDQLLPNLPGIVGRVSVL